MTVRQTAKHTVIVAWLVSMLAASAPAAALTGLDWDSLRPNSTPVDNPFERLTRQQLDWITTIAMGRLMQARGLANSAETVTQQSSLFKALAEQGLDGEELLRQRDTLIAQRRAAAQAPLADLAGREVRLVGYLLPASADGATVTDWLFVPWVGCSHSAMPANQIIRIAAQDLVGADRYGSQPLVLTGRIGVREQESWLRLVDGELTLRSAYVVEHPKLELQSPISFLPSPAGAPT